MAFILALPISLVLLGIALAAKWGWDSLRGTASESPDPGGRFFKCAFIGVGALTWLALMAISTLTPSRQTNDRAAITNLRTINTAQVTYLSSSGGNYGTIPNLIEARLLDSRFGDSTVSGYVLKVTLSGKNYIATAMPASRETGKYGHVSSGDAVIRYAEAATETCRPCFPRGKSGTPAP